MDVRVEDVTVCMNGRTREFSFQETGHRLLIITLTNGEEYAIDVAGAQFGLYTTIMPWTEYEQKYVDWVVARKDFVFAET